MNILKQFVIKSLREVITKIETDTCEMTQEELEDILRTIAHMPMSKELACNYMHMSRSVFDSKIKSKELPKGQKRVGFKELVWYKDELDTYISKVNK